MAGSFTRRVAKLVALDALLPYVRSMGTDHPIMPNGAPQLHLGTYLVLELILG
jgi:hypothetical protein